MENNSVYLQGTVKRDVDAQPAGDGCYILDFGVEVYNPTAERMDIFDCRVVSNTLPYDQCEGFLSKGDEVVLEGMLEKRTRTQEGRVGSNTVTVKSTGIFIYVEQFLAINDCWFDEESEDEDEH